MDNKNRLKLSLIHFLTVAGDLMVLNIVWLVCSLPIITIGPSTCALYKVCLKLAKGETIPVLKSYFIAFKTNFKQALIVGAFCLLGLISSIIDISYALAIEGILTKIYIVTGIIVIFVLLIIATYGLTLIVSYNNSLKGHIINAFKLAFINPIQTILLILILIAPILMFLFIQPIILLYVGWFILLYFCSLPIYLCSKVLVKIFAKFNEDGEIRL